MDSIYLYDKYGEPISHDLWTNVVRFIDWVGRHWREPDEGIWEVRGGRQEFLYSRVLCWAAIDRAIRLARKRSFPAPLARWHEERDAIYQDIFTHFWDAEREGIRAGQGLDRARRLLPAHAARQVHRPDRSALGVHPARDRARPGERLARLPLPASGITSPTGSPATRGPSACARSGTSSACRGWATCSRRASSSRRCSATRTTSASTARSSAAAGEHLGNFPQAFTHLALISAAYDLDRRLSAAGHAA